MAVHSPNLWHHADFLKFWAGQTISGVGSRFTGLALPLIAITVLKVSPAQLGILTALSGLPWLLLGLFVGVGVDQLRRRPVLIVTDMGRALLLASIPIAWWLDRLRIEQLYVVAFGVGTLSMWFDTAYQSYLPTLVDRAQLLDGNSKLGISNSAADVAGPSMAGVIIQALGAPIAIAIDAASFLVSVLCLWLIRTPESVLDQRDPQPALLRAVRNGLVYLGHQPLLRAFAGTNATFMFCYGMIDAVFLLFLTQRLGMRPSNLGLMFGGGSVGGLLGAIIAERISRQVGVGPAILGSSLLRGLGLALIPLVALVAVKVAPWLVVILYAIHQFGWSIWSVTQASVRQALVPDQLRGRVTASFLLLVRAAPPLGALLGGAVGEWGSVQMTLILAAPGLVLASLWLMVSPLRHLHAAPVQPIDA